MADEEREDGLDTPDGEEQSQSPTPRQGRGRKPRAPSRHDDRIAAERDGRERDYAEDRELTDDERLEMFRDSRFQSVLPDVPTIPGHHVCWLTTTNARDSIQGRLRQGYKLVHVSEIPGWDGVAQQVGAFDNVVAVNEMVLAKIPTRLFHLYMAEAHHNMPLAEEQKLVSKTESLMAEAEGMGAVLQPGDGLEALKQRAPRPGHFT